MTRPRRLPRIQYPLWVLFALTAFAAGCLSWLATFRHQCRHEQHLADSLASSVDLAYRGPRFLASWLMHRKEFQSVVFIDFTSPDPQRLHDLKSFRYLESLGIGSDEVADSDLAVLSSLRNLRRLYVNSAAINGEFADRLASCPSITLLSVEGLSVGKHFFDAVSRLPNLEAMELVDCDVDEQSLRQFARLPRLQHLDMAWSEVSNETIDAIRGDRPDIEIKY